MVYLSKHPVVERGKGLMLTGWIYRITDFFVEINEKSAGILQNLLFILQVQHPDKAGDFRKLQLAANMITTYYLEYKANKKQGGSLEELKRKIEDYFNRYPIK